MTFQGNLDEYRTSICEAALSLIREGNLPIDVAGVLGGMPTSTLLDWLESPTMAGRYARARDRCWDMRAMRLPGIIAKMNDAKMARVIADVELKLLARWCPQRYGEALLLKVGDAGDDGERELTNNEIIRRLQLVAKRPAQLALAAPDDIEDAEFSDAE